MRLLVISILLLLGVLIGNVLAGEVREVELNDGSVIYGEIVSTKGGIYTLKSGTLGTVKIEESKIRVIRFKPSGKAKGKQRDSAQTSSEAQVQVLQQLMMGDKETISMILSLLNDPEVQKVLQDPSIIKAVNSGDIQALISNPKFMKLLDNPAVKDISKKIVK
jgi:hypothetical protein